MQSLRWRHRHRSVGVSVTRVTAKRSTGNLTEKLRARVDEILTRLRISNPDPRCELYYETPFQLLVSVVLSAQATDKSVNEAMRKLYENGLSPADILEMGETGFLQKIRRIGLAPTKSKNVLKLSKIVHETYADHIPRTREELEALPGVGRKTANVILGEIYREPTIAVDTHVFRVTARLGLHNEASPEKSEMKLLSIIDKKWLPMAHHWFILHGRYTCLARAPKCEDCVLSDLCAFRRSTTSK
jgi:endonuclease-3